MTETVNLKLKKPSGEDFYNIDDFNCNADILDAAIAELSAGMTAADEAVKGKADAKHKHTVADITDFPEALPASGGNADKLDNMHANQFVQWLGMITDTEIVDNPNYPVAYECNIPKDIATSIGLSNYYYHIKYFKHRDAGDVGWGAQIAISTTGKAAKPMYRMCCNDAAEWSTWRSFADGGNAQTATYASYANSAGSLANTASNICLRNLSSGTADVTDTNCPLGAWYGQHE